MTKTAVALFAVRSRSPWLPPFKGQVAGPVVTLTPLVLEMAVESDCIAFQTSLPPSDASVSSLLATPELTAASSCGSENSYFSASSSHNSDFLHPAVGIQGPDGPIMDSPTSEIGFPEHVKIPSKITISLPSPAPRRPRKLRKTRPCVPKSNLDSSIPGSSISPSSPTPERLTQRPFLTWHIIPHRPSNPQPKLLKKSRRSSLPAIPCPTLYPPDKRNSGACEPDGESYENFLAARFVSPRRSDSKPMGRPSSPPPSTWTPNASTHALVSLAWTGQIPSSIWSHTDGPNCLLPTPGSESLGSTRSTWSEGNEDVYEHAPVSSTPRQRSLPSGHNRRWTLATAITSDEITDEMFVDEVETMRMKGTFWESRGCLVGEYLSSPTQTHALPALTDPLLSATWQTARRALLTCRELIRTERNYLASLFILVSNGTATTAPPLMLAYTPALIQASELLLIAMEANPSAQGVAEAFIEGEPICETAFVAWCGVSGGFFASAGSQTRLDRAASTSVLRETDLPIIMPLKRRVTTWVQSRRNSFVKSRESVAGLTSGRSNKASRAGRRSLPTVRDLAILPIQRVMRYALLFRDLLTHVPSSSPSYVFVERALQAAMAIARKSDRAQGNAAFLHQSV